MSRPVAEQVCAARGRFELGSRALLCRGKEWGWWRESQQRLRPRAVLVLLGPGARCRPCWGQEERQSKPLKAWGGGSGPICQWGKLCVPRALPGLPRQGVWLPGTV